VTPESSAIGGVTLDIVPANGPARRVVTDSAGRAIVASMSPGRAKVNSLAIGFKPGEVFVPLDVGRNTVPLILDGARIPALATVRVIGDRTKLTADTDWQPRISIEDTLAGLAHRNRVSIHQILAWKDRLLQDLAALEQESAPRAFRHRRHQHGFRRRGAARGGHQRSHGQAGPLRGPLTEMIY